MNYGEYYKKFVSVLSPLYEIEEAKSIGIIFFEDILGISKSELITKKSDKFTDEQVVKYSKGLAELIEGKPVQYVIGFTYFDGLRFLVNENVLIPRSETEHLVHLIKQEFEQNSLPIIVDFCTGSGCIAISLKNYFKDSSISGYDISTKALEVAQKNSKINNLLVDFAELDVLNYQKYLDIIPDEINLIVSNPPYVIPDEKAEMHINVLNHEPHIALFAPKDHPFIFYHAIAEIAEIKLKKGGYLYFECNQSNSKTLMKEMERYSFQSVKLVKDLREKERFIIIQK